MENKIEKNVLKFIEKCSNEIGKYKKEEFNFRLFFDCQICSGEIKNGLWGDVEIKSPIEQILYCAIKTIQELNEIPEIDPFLFHEESKESGKHILYGLEINRQYKINKFRVDFFLEYHHYLKGKKKQLIKELIIECDSQKWHERNEEERRYEKMRDRFLQKSGYKIFRYTGSEIIKRPFEIAREILSYLTEITEENLLIDSNIVDE